MARGWNAAPFICNSAIQATFTVEILKEFLATKPEIVSQEFPYTHYRAFLTTLVDIKGWFYPRAGGLVWYIPHTTPPYHIPHTTASSHTSIPQPHTTATSLREPPYRVWSRFYDFELVFTRRARTSPKIALKIKFFTPPTYYMFLERS